MTSQYQRIVTGIAAAIILAASMATAQWRGPGAGAPSRHWGTERTTAVAALEPVGEVQGWGRIMFLDLVTEDGIERRASISLLDLAPETEYMIKIDGQDLTSVETDAQGDACVAFNSKDPATEPVPDWVAAAENLIFASVIDPSSAPTLEGFFVITTNTRIGVGGLIYMDRIRLESYEPLITRGMARVARGYDDTQYFESRACGLTAGEKYEVHVNGKPLWEVTADQVGHGAIIFATDGEADPIPDELPPIEEMALVEWKMVSNNEVVLWGTFSGENMIGDGPNGNGNQGSNGNCGENGNGGDNSGGEGVGNDGGSDGGNGGDTGGCGGSDNGGGHGGV